MIAGLASLALVGCGQSGARKLDAATFDGRSPATAPARTLRVLVEMPRPSLAGTLTGRPMSAGAQRAYVDSLEREQFALRGSLRAKGIGVRRIRTFARVWDGFAATIPTNDFPKLQTAGVRAQPVRRFFPATAGTGTPRQSEAAGPAARTAVRPASEPRLALLDTGVDYRVPLLGGGIGRRHPVTGGYDVLDGDRKPLPDSGGREGVRGNGHGTQLAELLVGRGPGTAAKTLLPGGGLYAIRIAGSQPDPVAGGRTVYATTDQLIAGLERAVDPSGDGATGDHIPTALVGVNAPYAGFERSPEARAVDGAVSLGTAVVVPAGNEGSTEGRFGSIGSPGAAPKAITVGGLNGPAEAPHAELGLVGKNGARVFRALVMTPVDVGRLPPRLPVALPHGPSQADPKAPADHLPAATSAAELTGVGGGSKLAGAVAVLERRGSLGAQIAAAAGVGAALIVVCNPEDGAILPAVNAGVAQLPVLGLTGDAARKALRLFDRGTAPGSGRGLAYLSTYKHRAGPGGEQLATYSSRGPTLALGLKPDLAAPAVGVIAAQPSRDADPVVLHGTSVAAARVAAQAAVLRERHGDWDAADVKAALVGGAVPSTAPQPLAAGAGALWGRGAPEPLVLSRPSSISLGLLPAGTAWQRRIELTVKNPSGGDLALTVQAQAMGGVPGASAVVDPSTVAIPAHGQATLGVVFAGTRAAGPGAVQGFIQLREGRRLTRVPYAGYVGRPVKGLIGLPRIERGGGRVHGTRFVVGRFARAELGALATIEPVERLELELVWRNGKRMRVLTPPGGAPELLPGEYAYTLDKSTLNQLPKGGYRFRASAVSPDGKSRQVESSDVFELR